MRELQNPNYGIFGSQELQAILKNRLRCLKAGFPTNHPIIITLDEIRDAYVRQVGVAAYFSQMLAGLDKARHYKS